MTMKPIAEGAILTQNRSGLKNCFLIDRLWRVIKLSRTPVAPTGFSDYV